MDNGQNIIDKIITDAKTYADAIIEVAQKEADDILSSGKAKVQKEEAELTLLAKAEAEKIAVKEISSAQMQAKKMVLAKKQEIIGEVIEDARKKLLGLTDAEYKVIILGMLENAEVCDSSELIFSAKDKEILGSQLKSAGYKISDETREIEGGFVVKNDDIEYNYSFTSIMTVEKENIEQLTAEILFG